MIRSWLLALSQRAVRKAPAKQHGKARSPEAIRVKLDLWQYRASFGSIKFCFGVSPSPIMDNL
jgi:hypothetical protein